MHLLLLLALVLTCAVGAGSAEAAKPGSLPTYTVRKGDTLFGIARKTGIKVKEIQRLNHLRDSLLQPGQMLVLGTGPKLQARKVAAPPTPVAAVTTPAASAAATPAPVADAAVTATEVTGPPATLEVAAARDERTVVVAEPSPQPTATESFQPPGDPGLPQANADLQQVALAFLSTPYRFGAENRQATDCSGFTQQVFRECGLELPRTAREQFAVGAVVPEGEWQAGDLLFFRTYARYPSHVGIYLGDGRMIHASRSSRKVVISSVERPYFRKRFLGARRVVWFDPVASLIDNLAGKVEEVNDEGLFEADQALPPAPVEAVPPAADAPLTVPSPQAAVPAATRIFLPG